MLDELEVRSLYYISEEGALSLLCNKKYNHNEQVVVPAYFLY